MSILVRSLLACAPFALLTLGACSEAVLPPSEGAFTLPFQQPSGCQHKVHNAQVGNVDFQKASSFEIDGLDGAQVYCKVAGDGSFYVDAFIKGKGAQISVEIPSITEEATKTNPVTGTVRYLSSTTVKAYTSPPSDPCKFFLINDKQQINQGSLFISFQCPSLDNGETSPPSECATGEGRLALQNCDQE